MPCFRNLPGLIAAGLIVLASACSAPDRAHTPLPSAVAPPEGVEMIRWSSTTSFGGGGPTMTLWADGRSEATWSLNAYADQLALLRPCEGWNWQDGRFVKSPLYSPEETRAKLRTALTNGFHLLETHSRDYQDGGDYHAMVRMDGREETVDIPYFEKPERSENFRRFIAIERLLPFDKAFDIDRSRRTVPAMLKALQDPDPAVKQSAIRVLVELGDPAAIGGLRALLSDADPAMRARAQWGIEYLQRPASAAKPGRRLP